MDDNYKFVKFDEYCKKCEYANLSSTKEPCNTCLETGARIGTWVPEEFKEKKD